jgi:hypothetical protein
MEMEMEYKILFWFVLVVVVCGAVILAGIIERSSKSMRESFFGYALVFVVVAVLIFIASKVFN